MQSLPNLGEGILSRRRVGLGLGLAAAVYLSMLWIACYPKCDLDDKAVHYYCAARLYGDRARGEAVEEMRPTWLAKFNRSDAGSRARTSLRLSSFGVYIIPSSVLRVMIGIDRHSPDSHPRSFARPLKKAFLLLYIAGLVWILAVTWRDPLAASFLFTCLIIATLLMPPWFLAEEPRKDMLFFIYAPRGSAVLILLGTLAAAQKKMWIVAGIGLLLVFGWHVGFAAAAVPVAAAALGITMLIHNCPWRPRFVIAGLLLVVSAGVSIGAGSQLVVGRLWIPAIVVCILILSARSRFLATAIPLSLSASYLFVSQVFVASFGNQAFISWFSAGTGNTLVHELPLRLTGTTHVAACIMLFSMGIGLLDLLTESTVALAWRRRAFLLLAGIVIAFACVRSSDMFRRVTDGRGAFFHDEDAVIERRAVTTETLNTLNPRDEASFFASLGDFLVCGHSRSGDSDTGSTTNRQTKTTE